MPKISVLMANYNTPIKYLRESIDSILNQTFSDFEFIIIDDCSTDDSIRYLESLSDKRIILLKNEENLGLTKSLNKGLKIAKGQYIVRMDSDDISMPARIEKQVQFMEAHPNVIVAGSWVQYFGANDFLYKPIIETNEEYRVRLLFGNSPTIVHPSAIMNRESIVAAGLHYDERYRNAQDYKMWVDCSRYGDCTIIPEVLLKYRVHNNQISVGKDGLQNRLMKMIVEEQLKELKISPTEEQLEFHIDCFHQTECGNRLIEWFELLVKQNRNEKIFSDKAIKKVIAPKIQNMVIKNSSNISFCRAAKLMTIYDKTVFLLRVVKKIVLRRSSNAR